MNNTLTTLGLLLPGLIMPGLALAVQAGVPDWQYKIRPGDTLGSVAARYMISASDWQKLQKHNNIADPRRLQPSGKLRIPYNWLRQQPASADVVSVSGQAEVLAPGQPGRLLAKGEQLKVGSEIRTASNSSAALVFADGSRVVVQPDSVLKLDTVSVYANGAMVDTRVRLNRGQTEVFANPLKRTGNRLEVITPSAIAAVRGTVFRVGADASGIMREETLEGRVSVVAAAAEVAVDRAMGTLAEQGKPPIAPVALPAAPALGYLPVRFERYPLDFAVPQQAGVQGWFGQIAPDAKFETIVAQADTRLTSGRLRFADLPDGRYVLRMRGVDDKGLQGLDSQHAFEVDAHPLPPAVDTFELIKEVFTRHARPRLNWRAAAEAEKYRVQVSADRAFSKDVSEQVVTSTWLDIDPAQHRGERYWRVASIAGSGEQGPYSLTRHFEYRLTPPAPPVQTSKIELDDKELRIALPALQGGGQYLVTFAKGKTFEEVLWQGRLEGALFKTAKPAPGSYYFAAQIVDQDGSVGEMALFPVEIAK